MAQATVPVLSRLERFKRWLLEGHVKEIEAPHEREGEHPKHSWWQVMCLTGVDYFSTLGYQPGIAALAAGALSPIATLILVLVTLFGALPMYHRVAAESPHGDGSISMLEDLLPWWQGKLFVLCLIGFAATSFVITITLSAADATAHIIENPFTPAFFHHQAVSITLVLLALLGAIFLKGFKEAIGIAVVIVAAYLLLNFITISVGIYELVSNPRPMTDWVNALWAGQSNPLFMLVAALLLFPKLALGLSGFETGVVVMPLVQGDPGDTPEKPVGRIRNTRKLLTSAALIMSVFLMTSSFVTTLLIPHAEFEPGGKASGRALAYLAHTYLGGLFGTVYDLSTIAILWFAGASALAGLLNIVPRYLPRYGMAPDWARATRPLVLVFTATTFAVTILFGASVEAQAGAYATGVLVLMTSAAIAVTLSVVREATRRQAGAVTSSWLRPGVLGFVLISLVFIYATVVNVVEQPGGLKIALFFIGAILITSLISRTYRSTELRTKRIELDAVAEEFIQDAGHGRIRIIANRLNRGDETEYRLKEREVRADTHIPAKDPVLFLEITVCDASEFDDVIEVKGVEVGKYRVLRADSTSVANAIAAFLLDVRDKTGKIPHIYFEWGEGNPLKALFRFLVFGEGDIPPVTREILRQAEPDPERRPGVHVGG